jgi:hypothetical protein
MQVKGHKKPKKIELRQQNGKIKEYFLRDNIIQEEIENQEGNLITQYMYDEVKIELVNRNNLEIFIKDNFTKLFEKAIIKEDEPTQPKLEERLEALESMELERLMSQ